MCIEFLEFFEFCLSWVMLDSIAFSELARRPHWSLELGTPTKIHYTRRVIENSFGILAARWRLFRRPILAQPSTVVVYSQAALAIHNYLRTTESTVYCPPGKAPIAVHTCICTTHWLFPRVRRCRRRCWQHY